MNKNEVFAKRLKALLETHRVSQRELALAIGKSEALISHYLRGIHIPRYNTLSSMADFFGVPADYLLGNVDDPSTIPERLALNNVLQDSNMQMTPEARQAIQKGILTKARVIPFIENIKDGVEITEQIKQTKDRFIIPAHYKGDFVTALRVDYFEPNYTAEDIVILRLTSTLKYGDHGIGLFKLVQSVMKRAPDSPELIYEWNSMHIFRAYIVGKEQLTLTMPAYLKDGVDESIKQMAQEMINLSDLSVPSDAELNQMDPKTVHKQFYAFVADVVGAFHVLK